MRVYFTDADGKKKPAWFASYGIGSTRVMGALVEASHDGKGIVWFPQVTPFDVHLIELPGRKKAKKVYKVKDFASSAYKKLINAGIDVLWDDRDISVGEKFSDADLIGIPVRLVVSEETGDKVEWKKRTSDKKEVISLEQIVKRLK